MYIYFGLFLLGYYKWIANLVYIYFRLFLLGYSLDYSCSLRTWVNTQWCQHNPIPKRSAYFTKRFEATWRFPAANILKLSPTNPCKQLIFDSLLPLNISSFSHEKQFFILSLCPSLPLLFLHLICILKHPYLWPPQENNRFFSGSSLPDDRV